MKNTEINDMESILKSSLIDILRIDEAELGKCLSHLELDSIKYIQLIVVLEDAFQIEFDDEELDFHSYSDYQSIKELIERKLMNGESKADI